MHNLPICDVLEEIKQTLNQNQILILQAPPGAGKSTLVPISLLKEGFLEDKMIVMLEPRRVAARMVASQMAKLLKEELGKTVGYQVKNDSCYSKDTKLLIVTEAILTRKLQSDQALEEVGLIIFDEFHERSIHTDLSLALSLQTQELLRDDLKLLIMSATLNENDLVSLLGSKVPVITSKGKSYEVQNIYLDENIKQPDKNSINQVLLKTLEKALKQQGDILVFLSGTKEINSFKALVEEKLPFEDIEILPLYSNLEKKQQDKALEKRVKRKIILSTNIAQTSLTIEGVKIVIDTGLEKLSFYNSSNFLNHLEQTFISQDSAVQRAGRAGRLSNGICYKLWHEKKILQKSTVPEILRSDLASFFLETSLWGIKDLEELKLLDYPSKQNELKTKEVLQELCMLNSDFEITNFGVKALSLGLNPRFSYMILKANELGFAYEACLLASLLEEKDIFKNSFQDSNLYSRFLHLLENDIKSTFINTFRAKTIISQANIYFKKLKAQEKIKAKTKQIDGELLAVLCLFAYPDRLAKLRVKNDIRYKLSNAKGAVLNLEDSLFNEEFLVVPNLNAQNKNSYINYALQISLDSIKEYFSHLIDIKQSISYKKEAKKIEIKEEYTFIHLTLYSKPLNCDESIDYEKLFINLLKKEGLALLVWSKKALELKYRVNFIKAHKSDIELPSFQEEDLKAGLDIWLRPYLSKVKTIKQLEELDLYTILHSFISWDLHSRLDVLAPSFIKVPSGSNIKIDYENTQTPILKVKIQEVFGLSETPKILNGSVKLQMHLLSPALRPIQITYDLKSFWDNSYDEVRKELFSKYKKHYWPINPYEAIATNKTKKKM